jgi:hypothetical protein
VGTAYRVRDLNGVGMIAVGSFNIARSDWREGRTLASDEFVSVPVIDCDPQSPMIFMSRRKRTCRCRYPRDAGGRRGPLGDSVAVAVELLSCVPPRPGAHLSVG